MSENDDRRGCLFAMIRLLDTGIRKALLRLDSGLRRWYDDIGYSEGQLKATIEQANKTIDDSDPTGILIPPEYLKKDDSAADE
jgi:hypothetical protein